MATRSQSKQGDLNPSWKGDEVGYVSLHEWVRNHLPKPDRCQDCGKKTSKLDLANISQKYLRDLSDWEYLCRKCHMTKDGRLEKAIRDRRAGIYSMPGDKNPSAKLTSKQVIEIKEYCITRQYSTKDLARIFNVSRSTIYGIWSGDNWRSI